MVRFHWYYIPDWVRQKVRLFTKADVKHYQNIQRLMGCRDTQLIANSAQIQRKTATQHERKAIRHSGAALYCIDICAIMTMYAPCVLHLFELPSLAVHRFTELSTDNVSVELPHRHMV